MNLEQLPFSFFSGIATFFSPCCVAMLPAYVSYYLGRDRKGAYHSWLGNLSAGLELGAVTSAGFFTVFIVLGLLISAIGSAIMQYLPWIGAAIAAFLIVWGALLLLGKSPSLSLYLYLHLPWPRLKCFKIAQNKAANTKEGVTAFYFFGISYALASVGCTLPVFLVVVSYAFSGSLLNGVIHFLAYALGMTMLMLALALVMTTASDFVYKYLNSIVEYVQRASGAVLIAAGGYLIYYLLFYSRVISF